MTGRRGFLGSLFGGIATLLGLGIPVRAARRDDLSKLLLGENLKMTHQVTPLLHAEKIREGYIQFSKGLNLRNPNHARFCQERLNWHFGKLARGFKRLESRYTISADGNRYDYRIVDQEMHS